jgi:hypothetical protein
MKKNKKKKIRHNDKWLTFSYILYLRSLLFHTDLRFYLARLCTCAVGRFETLRLCLVTTPSITFSVGTLCVSNWWEVPVPRSLTLLTMNCKESEQTRLTLRHVRIYQASSPTYVSSHVGTKIAYCFIRNVRYVWLLVSCLYMTLYQLLSLHRVECGMEGWLWMMNRESRA